MLKSDTKLKKFDAEVNIIRAESIFLGRSQ